MKKHLTERRRLSSLCIATVTAMAAMIASGVAHAGIEGNTVKIGLLTDMSGAFSQFSGQGSVVAAQMAIDDCLAKECKGLKIQLLTADHQNKTDIALSKAREWADVEHVDAYADMVNSAVALAMENLAVQKKKIALFVGGPLSITNENCQPEYAVQWMWDTYSQTAAAIKGLAKPKQGWYFVTVDYAYGLAATTEARKQLDAIGAQTVGESKHPLNTSDMSSQIIAAQQSKADVVAFANSGADAANAIKTASEFQLGAKKQLAAFFPTVYEIKGIGLSQAQGLQFPESFYWDLDDGTRSFSKRFMELYKKGPPSLTHAGVYSSVYHYLKAVVAADSKDPALVMRKMHELPIKDDVVRNATLRADGRMIHDYYYFKVKSPKESKGPWDLYTLQKVLPGEQVFLPASQSQCRALKKSTASR
ncbi:ABC transporter permease [Pandoraea bronchicola]|uniref:ABC transporter permease n=1 Tax=Pandoraea bronchicola TaxID=2508287 RepID=A0A5E5BPA0_9BURK|nr:ABC transporter permease [Pandoraea bronchicola]